MIALLASIGVHLPVYQVLGILAEALLKEEPAPAAEPSLVEFELTGEDPEDAEEPRVARAEPDKPRSQQPPKVRARSQPRKRTPVPVPTPPDKPKPRPPKPPSNRLAVEQKSDDPEVAPPPDSRFIAEENRRVEEETVARATNLQRDDEPQAASHGGDETMGDGADKVVRADLQDAPGDDSRRATAEEAELERESEALGAGRPEGSAAPERRSQAQAAERSSSAAGSPAAGGEPEPVVLHDGEGTLVIRRPRPAQGAGDRADRRPGERNLRPSDRDRAAGARGANLTISYRQFENTFGSENLRRQREAYAAQQRSRATGGGRGARWRKFRAAIENYVPHVRPGNQTALNAAASPFAAYLAAVHRRIHSEFALGFLRNLPLSGGPYDDPTLNATLEIVINADGSLHHVGVIRTSGLLPFDFGAFDAVMRAAPFATPPRNILSADGRVYVHWGFHRGPRQCGTFNASPFILRSPGNDPGNEGGDAPLRDRGVPPVNAHDSEMGQLDRRASPEEAGCPAG